MNSEELLLHHARKYLRLSEEFGPDAVCVNEQFKTLRDLLIVEIYFMNSIRLILSDEEMSGFVLYVEGSLRTMIDSFDPKREFIMPFLKHNMENRALSYLESERRSKCFSSQFANYFLAIEPEYPGPEDILTCLKDEFQSGIQEKAIDRLRYLCAENPSSQRHLFVFLCTILPYATPEMIDNFCGVLNIDKAQTFTIADYLQDMYEESKKRRSRREYLKERRNFFLMRRIELESHLRHSIYPESLKRKLRYQYEHLNTINKEISHRKMNIRYQLLAEVLGIDSSYIATSVYRSKKVLKLVSIEETEQNSTSRHCRNLLRLSDKALKHAMPNRFEPFEQFHITLVPKPNTHIRFSAQDMGIA